MSDCAHEDEDAVEGEGHEEQVEVAIVPLADTVAHPGAVVVEPLHAVVADGAVRGSRRPEYLAGEAELELDRLPLDLHLLGSGRRSVRGARTIPRLLYFPLNIFRLGNGRSRSNF